MQKRREELIKERDAARAERAVSFCFIRFGCFVRFVVKWWAVGEILLMLLVLMMTSADDSLCSQSVVIVCLTAVQVCVLAVLVCPILCYAWLKCVWSFMVKVCFILRLCFVLKCHLHALCVCHFLKREWFVCISLKMKEMFTLCVLAKNVMCVHLVCVFAKSVRLKM